MNLQIKMIIYFIFVVIASSIILAITTVPVIKITTIGVILILGIVVPHNIFKALDKDTKRIKELEEREFKDNRKLMEYEQMTSGFVSLIGHELRTPLASVKEGIALIADETTGKVNPQQGKMLSIAQKNIERLTRLINDVLDLSRMETGKLGIRRERLQLNTLLEDISKDMTLQAKGKNIKFREVLAKDLPHVYADPDRVIQVVTNLVNNAIKYSSSGGTITIVTRKKGPRFVETSIEDTGIGIKSSDYDRLFSKFQQIDYQMTRRADGVGLGLAITKGLVEAHGGMIGFESEFKRGSRFYFTLPLYHQDISLEQCLQEELKAKENLKGLLSLVLIKIESYSTLGQEVREGLEALIRKIVFGAHDKVVVYKNEGFAMLARTDRRGATAIAERISKNIYECKLRGDNERIRAKTGIATYPEDVKNPEKIITRAEKSLNQKRRY
ncbi:MAG: ATP-binding protein [bacterium]